MRIAQITDLHIDAEGETLLGVDVRGNFLKLLEVVRELCPQRIVLSGDLSNREDDRSVYAWIKSQLDSLAIPYELISGNHDDPKVMAEVFGRQADLHHQELYFAREWDGWPVFFLDTTTGFLSLIQQEWLKEQLRQCNREAIIFMHHPPFFADVPHMDNKYPLRNRDDVEKILFAHPHSLTIFSGHYHVEKCINKRNVTAYITPSGYFQIDQHHEDFQVDHYRPGLREITLNGEAILHTVLYI